jgi:hypothetical protein
MTDAERDHLLYALALNVSILVQRDVPRFTTSGIPAQEYNDRAELLRIIERLRSDFPVSAH